MIKARIVIVDDVKIKKKLPSKVMPQIPSAGDKLAYLDRDFVVDQVAWDLELQEVEAVLFVTEVE